MEVLIGTGLAIKDCFDQAKSKGYIMVGLQNGNECWASQQFGKHGHANDVECNYLCDVDKEKSCGGKLRNAVWNV